MNIEIRPLTKDLKDQYLFLFDNMIHKENPEWSKCYCNDYHFLGNVETCTRELSRTLIINRINDDELQGYLAFENDKPIGWCNANNRSNYQRLLRDYDLIDNPDDKVYSVVCFLIHPDYRRQGITQKILEKIITEHSNTDYDYIEAYPKKGETSNSNFNGPLELFKRNDFKIHKEHDAYYVMRKKLK
ncbi:MAG: GNAT family N-acetyltransferase [Ignavibacteriae bacterium]|nr:GNAT family N-acetyltransferase [Ignavibacteriota bacterium]